MQRVPHRCAELYRRTQRLAAVGLFRRRRFIQARAADADRHPPVGDGGPGVPERLEQNLGTRLSTVHPGAVVLPDWQGMVSERDLHSVLVPERVGKKPDLWASA